MRKLRKQTMRAIGQIAKLAIMLFLAIAVALPSLIPALSNPAPAYAAGEGWLDGWSYRKSVTISRASGLVTNYQMQVLVGETAGAVGETVDCDGKIATDFDDLRFTSDDGETLLDYWIESISGATPNLLATVWVEFDSIGTSATTFYMYYGNTGASAASSGANTFIVFDDFERGVNNDAIGGAWTVAAGSPVISTDHGYGGSRSGKFEGNESNAGAWLAVTASDNIAIRFRYWKEANTGTVVWYHGNGVKHANFSIDVSENIYTRIGTTLTDTGFNSVADQWGLIEANNFVWSTSYDLWADSVQVKNDGGFSDEAWESGHFYVQNQDATTGDDLYIDDVVVRNYRTTEPAWGSWGDEQIYPADWLAGWTYRKHLSIRRPSGAVSNYQMQILVGESSGASGETVDCGGHVATDFDDLRFTKADGTTLLDYYIESISGATPNQLASVWVEFDSIGTTGTLFFMYYGNGAASAYSNGSNTFIAFSDIESGNNGDTLVGVQGWGGYNATVSTDHAYGGTRSGKVANSGSASQTVALQENVAIRVKYWKEDASNQVYAGIWGNGSKALMVYMNSSEDIRYYTGTWVDNDTGYNVTADTWTYFEFRNLNLTTWKYDAWYNGTQIIRQADMSNYAGYSGVMGAHNDDAVAGHDVYIDTWYVRNWRSTEPIMGSWSVEEDSAENWLTGYSFRKQLNVVGGSDGAQTDYPLRLKVYKSPSATVIDNVESTTGFGSTDSCTLSADSTVKTQGTASLKATTTNTDIEAYFSRSTDLADISAATHITFWAKATETRGGQLYLANNAWSAYTWYQITWPTDWKQITIDLSSPLGSVGSLTPSTIGEMRFDYDSQTNGSIFWIDDIQWRIDDGTVYGSNGFTKVVTAEGKSKSDFTDIKFTTTDGDTELSYWKQEYTSDSYAIFWVELNSSGAASISKDFYMYYGKSDATDTGSGANTFTIFEDFTGAYPGTWTQDTGNGSVAGGVLTYTVTPSATKQIVDSTTTSGGGWAFGGRGYGAATQSDAGFGGYVGGGFAWVYWSAGSSMIYTSDGGSATYTYSNFNMSAYHNYDIQVRGGVNVRVFTDGTEVSNSPKANNPPAAGNAGFIIHNYKWNAGADGSFYVDYMYMRKYVYGEPTLYEVGFQEEPAPVLVSAPTVTTQAASALSYRLATLNGNITDTGGENATTRGFQYDVDSGAPYASDTHTDGSYSTGAYTADLTGLNPGTTYYARAYATNSAGTGYGDEISFTTTNNMQTDAATAINYTIATLNGQVLNMVGEASWTVSFEYGLTTAYGSTAVGAESPLAGIGTFHADIVGLDDGTLYHFRAKGVGGAMTVYGADATFTTVTQNPTVTTQAATGVTMDKDAVTGGTFNGNLTNLGDDTDADVSFQYGLTDAYGSETTPSNKIATGAFTGTIPAGLTPGQTYHYRSKAVNSHGTGYGGDQSFTFTQPTFTSQAATSVAMDKDGVTSGSFNLNISSMGVATSAYYDFEYGLTVAYGADIGNQTASGTGDLSGSIPAALTPGETYHFRARIINGAVISNGGDLQFTFTMPSFTTAAASSLTMDKDGLTGGNFNGNISNLQTASDTYVYFEYGLTVAYGDTTAEVPKGTTGDFSASVPTDLTPGETYHFRAKVKNGATVSNGGDQQFTLTMPSFTTSAPTYTSPGAAESTLEGNVSNLNVASDCYGYFEWGYDTSYGTSTAPQTLSGTGDYTQLLTSFLRNTAVHYRAVIEVGATTVTGADQSFMIESPALTEKLKYQPITIITNYAASGTADAGNTTTLTDAALAEANDYWNFGKLTITDTTDDGAPKGETAVISDFGSGILTFAAALTAGVEAGDTYYLEVGVLPDRDGGDQDARITWGTALTGSPGAITIGVPPTVQASPPIDILPEAEGSDWFVDPDISTTLANNPFRPLVTMLSDNTALTEIQSWRLLGLVFVLFVTVTTGRAMREHLFIVGLACGAAILILVVLTIWPLWALVFVAGAVGAGMVAERTPSL